MFLCFYLPLVVILGANKWAVAAVTVFGIGQELVEEKNTRRLMFIYSWELFFTNHGQCKHTLGQWEPSLRVPSRVQ